MRDKFDAAPVSTMNQLEMAALLLGQGENSLALFEAVIEGIAQRAGAERVSLLALEPGQGELRLLASLDEARPADIEELPPDEVQQALAEGEAHFTGPASNGLVLPLNYGGRAVGVIYASSISPTLSPIDLPDLQALANLAAAALDRDNLAATLESAEQARRDFVSLTTHQLRVPLTSISGYTDLMLSGIAGSLAERQEQFMLTVQRNVERMTLLITDLSDLNRIQDGRMPFSSVAFDLKEVIESVLREQAEEMQSRGHDLSLQLPDGLPPAYADRPAVKRVFAKILDNAILYTPDGGLLTVGAIHYNRHLQVTVADNGIGIDLEDQAQLFTPFFRSEVEAVREHTGWGLSLAVSKALLEAQDGKLWYESEPGQGAVFHFALPVAGTETPAASS